MAKKAVSICGCGSREASAQSQLCPQPADEVRKRIWPGDVGESVESQRAGSAKQLSNHEKYIPAHLLEVDASRPDLGAAKPEGQGGDAHQNELAAQGE